MKHAISVLAASCVILLVLASGCADVTAKQKVGDFGTAFGTSSDEQKAIDWFKTTYGDPLTNNDQPARLLEPMITTGLSTNNMPVDKVTTFPVSGGSVYFFVIYDNFKKGDPITVSWVYMENGREVTRVEKQAGSDFGRFIVEFQKPDSGWGKGNQRITITGDGSTESVDFAIGDALEITPLPYAADSAGQSSTHMLNKPQVGATPLRTIIQATPAMRTIAPALTVRKPDSFQTIKPLTCTGTETMCGDSCVDSQNNVSNCGRCGVTCYGGPNSRPYCWQGKCASECLPGYRFCEKNLYDVGFDTPGCVPMQGDPNHCGSCDKKCYPGETCENERCVPPTCAGGLSVCKGQCANYENDPHNCGGCGNDCQVPGGYVTCDLGRCVLQSCGDPISVEFGFFKKCHDDDTTCTDTKFDKNNCGACGNLCNFDTPYCYWGKCMRNNPEAPHS